MARGGNIGKFLCYVLRHNPDAIGLRLDKKGWAEVDDLIKRLNDNGKKVDMKTLKNIVNNDNKTRYSFNDDKTKICANYGHSIEVYPDYVIEAPNQILYHGTAEKYLDSILKNGVNSKSRNFVHLSKDVETAIKVGSRHGKPVVLKIDTNQMVSDGYKFYKCMNGVWLADEIPVKYIEIV